MLWGKLTILCLGCAILYVAISKILSAGRKSEQLERLKKEVKERAKANEIVSKTINLNSQQLLDRVHEKRSAQAGKRSVHSKN